MEEKKYIIILDKEEKISKIKIRALWMEAGDKNTKYFYRFSSHRRNINTILEIKDEAGGTEQNFKEKTKATVDHFKKIFTAPPGFPIFEIIEVLNSLPLINHRRNEGGLIRRSI